MYYNFVFFDFFKYCITWLLDIMMEDRDLWDMNDDLGMNGDPG
jgi:hypothetical protein